MSFPRILRVHMDELGCTARELAQASDLSSSAISRYLKGRRAPSADGDVPDRLAVGMAALAARRGCPPIDTVALATELRMALDPDLASRTDPGALARNLRQLMETLDIAGNRLARSMGYDPSYISRILGGKRHPADMARFVEGVAAYVARNCGDERSLGLLSDLTGLSVDDLRTGGRRADATRSFLRSELADIPARPNTLESFLTILDESDLDDFLVGIDLEGIHVPTLPIQLPTTKVYQGIEEMKQAELDFLKAAALSPSTEDVILYSDMPLGQMATDDEFARKVMLGMAMLVRKGVHLHNIHDVHRPLNELIMGLEGWIPVYMTGQISPYYLPEPTNHTFLHFLRSAGTVAVQGEAIRGHHASGRYVVSKAPSDVSYYRQRAKELLAQARPLMRIYRDDRLVQLERDVRALASDVSCEPTQVGEGTFRNMTILVWPGSHALIEKDNPPKVAFLIEHPALVDALARYQPTLL